MNKNVKRIFFVTTILLLLVSISALSATDASNDTSSTIQQDVVKEINVEKISDTLVTDTTSKNIKKVETVTDLYVSDTDGSDDNSGTNTSPYKTIQKALDTTNSDSTFNIHILEGTYKGLGNTNLTVNGNYNINIIGSGNNTIIDGEAKYDIDTEQYHWDSSDIWSFYVNGTGNWIMNITEGSNQIKISNMTIQNAWAPGINGGDAINEYPFATIDNYGNLEVTNVYFYNNHGGVGSAIRNNLDATLTVNNSTFIGNRKSESTGNDGIIYNNGTAIIQNSLFDKNYARWGQILNDKQLTIINSTIKNGIPYDGNSAYNSGTGVASNSGTFDFYSQYQVDGVKTYVYNSTFINNTYDIYQGIGDLIVEGNIFNQSSGIYALPSSQTLNESIKITIKNNTFTQIMPTILTTLISTENNTIAINIGGNSNATIENNIFNTTNSDSKSIRAANYVKIQNNTIYNQIEVSGSNNIIKNNTINTNSEYTISLNTQSRNNTIIDNELISAGLVGDASVKSARNNTIVNNTPSGESYEIYDETYPNFFDENGNVIPSIFKKGSNVYLIGEFNNKDFILNDTKITLIGNNNTLINSTITIGSDSQLTITNITINNQDKDSIIIESPYNIIQNNTINSNTNCIIIKSDSNNILNNTINITNEQALQVNITAIESQSSNNQIEKNNIYINSTTDSIAIKLNMATENKIRTNNIQIQSTENAIGYYAHNSNKLIDNNNIIKVISDKNAVGKYLYNSNSFSLSDSTTSYTTNATAPNSTALLIENSHNEESTTNITTPQVKGQGNNFTAIKLVNTSNIYINTPSNVRTIDGKYIELIDSNNNYILHTLYAANSISASANDNAFTINNCSNIEIRGMYIARANIGYNITNSNNILISNNKGIFTGLETSSRIQSNQEAVHITNSTNIYITNSTINTNTNKTIILENTNNTQITYNTLKCTESITGDRSVTQTDSFNNTVLHNAPNNEKIMLTQENYDTYFENGILKNEYITPDTEIILSSDITNKDLLFIFDNIRAGVSFSNPEGYTVYNSTFKIQSPETDETAGKTATTITGLKLNNTDNRQNAINITTALITLNNITVYQNNTDNPLCAVNIKDLSGSTITNLNLTIYGPEIETSDNSPSTLILNTSGFIRMNQINIYGESTITDHKGYIQAMNIADPYGSLPDKLSMIIIAKENAMGINYIKLPSTTTQGNSMTQSNIYIEANNNTIFYNGTLYKDITQNNITLKSNNTLQFCDFKNTDIYCGYIQQNNISLEYQNNEAIPIKANKNNQTLILIKNNNITSNGGSTLIDINNTMTQITNNIIKTENTGTIIKVSNSINSNISYNYIIGLDTHGTNAIELTNVSDIFLYYNIPQDNILTNDNYDEYFTNQTLTKENVEQIELGSDLYNKNLTFNKEVEILNPNNYTIYNTTIKNTENKLTITDLIINNTNYPYSTIVTNNILLKNSIIYAQGNNQSIILLENCTDSTTCLENNKISSTGNNNTILKLNNNRFNNNKFTSNNITIIGENNTAISCINTSNCYIINNNIQINNYSIPIIIDNADSINVNDNTILAEKIEGSAINIINSNATITNNYIITKTTKGNLAINSTNSQTKITNNRPIPKLTDDNYNQFFDMTGEYIGNPMEFNLEIASDIHNKNFTFNKNFTLTNPNKYILYNTTIKESANQLTITDLIINNSNYPFTTIIGNGSNIILENNTIYQSGNNLTSIILKDSQFTSIFRNNNITCEGHNNTIINCSNITFIFQYNNLYGNGTNITALYYNNVGMLNLGPITIPLNIPIYYNNITITSKEPTTAVKIDYSSINFYYNQIIINTNNGEIPLIDGINSPTSKISYNYIEALDICGNQAVSSTISKSSNTPTTTGFYSKISNIILPRNIFTNTKNNIIVNVTDSFGREITGTITITDNEITTMSNNNTINYNPQTTGQKTLTITYTDPTGKYNTSSTTVDIEVTSLTLKVDPITSKVGDIINITARITVNNETMTELSKGKITFKVNGKTLKDANGKIIYAKVVNGTATIENYIVPDDWVKDGTTIQAVYSGSTQCAKLSSEKTNMTVTPEELTLTTTATQAALGQTTTLTATLSDNTINTGKIVFKINGKTVKDANGKVIYAKIVNGTVSVDYTLPESYKAGNYTVTATFIASGYDKLEATESLTVTA